MALKIKHLEVKFDVEGEGDEAVFAKLFDVNAERWNRKLEEDRARQRHSNNERCLGDREHEVV